MKGLKTAIVNNNVDPFAQGRIQITLPSLTTPIHIWARMGNLYATNHAGVTFIPEIGDEVIVGFLNDDIRYPIILGSLHSSTQQQPITIKEGNTAKAITTFSGLKIAFDDDRKTITIATPAGNSVSINDDEKSILIKDQNGNQINMTPDGILIDSAKNIELNAKGEIIFNAQQQLSAIAKGDVKIAGLNINATADMGIEIIGNAAAELSSNGQTVIKGTMVMIN
ncbi:MAG: hypothetical protein EOP00_21135 [Pedobacter sp.]|nr:MAG: hypothetical protein EOP00_21135 [Pedobacter sp.]